MSKANSQLPFFVVMRVRGLKYWASVQCQRCSRKMLITHAHVYKQRGKTMPCAYCFRVSWLPQEVPHPHTRRKTNSRNGER